MAIALREEDLKEIGETETIILMSNTLVLAKATGLVAAQEMAHSDLFENVKEEKEQIDQTEPTEGREETRGLEIAEMIAEEMI